MGRKITFLHIVGLIKDKASQSKALILSKPTALSLRLAVLRATTHSPPAPPDDRRLSALLLLLGDSSRATASALITALMDRLHRTKNSIVALKCLLIIHNIIKRGPFILQDQLSIFPTTGGHNYLKLSSFRDGATAATWVLSSWVRWYARYLETMLSTSRVLGYFLSSSSCSMAKENQEQKISSLLHVDLIRAVDSLVLMIEETCKAPDNSLLVDDNNTLVKEIMALLLTDYLSAVNGISLRLGELNERLSQLSFGDSVELACSLNRLQDCKERLSDLYMVKKPSIEMLWCSVQELKDGIGVMKDYYKEGRKLLTFGGGEKASESARFERRVMKNGDSVKFQSGRIN